MWLIGSASDCDSVGDFSTCNILEHIKHTKLRAHVVYVNDCAIYTYIHKKFI